MSDQKFIRKVYLTILLCSWSILSLTAQVNIKIGYNLGFPQLAVTDQVLSSYAPADSEVIESFGSIGFMHGIQLGVRYRLGNMAAEFGWESISRDKTALAYKASNDSFSARQYSFALSGLSFGLDNYIGRFGVGSTILYQKLKINRTIGNNSLKIIGDRQFGLRLHFIWQVQESDLVSLMIKPYYQFSLGNYNLRPLADDINSPVNSDFIESPKVFGISLVFYNGRQR